MYIYDIIKDLSQQHQQQCRMLLTVDAGVYICVCVSVCYQVYLEGARVDRRATEQADK